MCALSYYAVSTILDITSRCLVCLNAFGNTCIATQHCSLYWQGSMLASKSLATYLYYHQLIGLTGLVTGLMVLLIGVLELCNCFWTRSFQRPANESANTEQRTYLNHHFIGRNMIGNHVSRRPLSHAAFQTVHDGTFFFHERTAGLWWPRRRCYILHRKRLTKNENYSQAFHRGGSLEA